jgi:hypothetical protein
LRGPRELRREHRFDVAGDRAQPRAEATAQLGRCERLGRGGGSAGAREAEIRRFAGQGANLLYQLEQCWRRHGRPIHHDETGESTPQVGSDRVDSTQ